MCNCPDVSEAYCVRCGKRFLGGSDDYVCPSCFESIMNNRRLYWGTRIGR